MTGLQRWNPVRDLSEMEETFERFFDRGFGRPFRLVNWEAAGELFPVDVAETDQAVTVKASLPGVSPDEVEIAVTGNKLVIKGETSSQTNDAGATYHRQELHRGSFYRAMMLPAKVDADNAEAEFDNGVLSLTLPKAADVLPKTIQVKTKDGQAKVADAS